LYRFCNVNKFIDDMKRNILLIVISLFIGITSYVQENNRMDVFRRTWFGIEILNSYTYLNIH
jgi:hypothetical protein